MGRQYQEKKSWGVGILDELDKIILLTLAQNCRVPYQTLARNLGISSNAVKKRVDSLLERGVIVKFTAELSLDMFGGDTALCIIETDGSEDEQAFCNVLGENPMVGVVGPCSGTTYMIFATYIGNTGLMDLGVFLRKQESVKSVEIFPLIFPRGKKTKYSKSHLKVLKCLVQNARMSVSEISKITGLAARSVRRLIDEIIEGEGVRLSLWWELNSSDRVVLMAKTRWFSDKTDIGDLLHWFNSQFPEFYTPIIAATEPVIFAAFVCPDLKRLNEITNQIKSSEKIESVSSILGRPSFHYPDLKQYELDNLFLSLK